MKLEPPYAVIGLGLLGGSIARALRSRTPTGEIIGVDPNGSHRDAALRGGVITRATAQLSHTEGLERCSVVFVCVPIAAMSEVFEHLANRLTTTIVTDVAGSKQSVEKLATSILGDIPFVGGHPMAGGERGGFRNSRPDLFRGQAVALCPPDGASHDPARGLEALWKSFGAKPVILSAAEHDRIVAHTSHLPYLCALAQVELMGERPNRWQLLGRGFRDATRHVAFAPEVMAAVCSSNADLPRAARALADTLHQLADLAEKNPQGFTERAEALQKLRATYLID